MSGWIGVDLDGTLAVYDGWTSETHIGPPIPRMVERVKDWLAAGVEVRIVTARVSKDAGSKIPEIVAAIENWCLEHLGAKLKVTNEKDYSMVALWDDRAVQVIKNTGMTLGDFLDEELT